MAIKISVLGKRHSLFIHIEDVEENQIGEEVAECITRFKTNYDDTIEFIDIIKLKE